MINATLESLVILTKGINQPSINLNPAEGIFRIKGRSILENYIE